MSEVISFRLDRNNPREGQAMAVLRKGQEAGYSLRHILTEALLALEASAEDEQQVLAALAEVSRRMEQIRDALESLKQVNMVPVQMHDDHPIQAALAESFLFSVKNAAKPGVRIGAE
ncbi:MAG: hypothetical protein JXJ17_13300 [Anaerolineae bacterium]|nr:hypothetical protein [Anaerolineae bacterium]